MSNSIPVIATSIDDIFVFEEHIILLLYEGCWKFRHWDEIGEKSDFIPGLSWSSSWPSNLVDVLFLESRMQYLLRYRNLRSNQKINVDVLDVSMVRLLFI